jgi:uncharacterized protein (DUF983 family)
MSAPIISQQPKRRPAVTRFDILTRGLRHRCPNCGADGVFRGLFQTNKRCDNCNFLVEREDGFFLGAMAINFAAGALPMVIIFVLVFMEKISVPLAMAVVIVWGIIVPVFFYRTSRSLWLMLVYLCIPTQLPANREHSGKEYDDHF